MFESVILGVLGSLLGLALAYGALQVLVAMAPTDLPRIHEIGIDLPVLGIYVCDCDLLRACCSGLFRFSSTRGRI